MRRFVGGLDRKTAGVGVSALASRDGSRALRATPGTRDRNDRSTRGQPKINRLMLRQTSCRLLTAALLVCGSSAGAQETSVRPGINAHYRDPDYAHWVSVFETPQREVFARREAILETLQLRPGMRVADIGAGTGLFTRLLAEAVGPQGQVYAVDITPAFVDRTVQRVREEGWKNVEGIVNAPTSTGLPDASVDLAFLCNTYHHFEYPRSMLHSIRDALSRNGELVVIDFRKQPGLTSAWVMEHVRAGQDEVTAEIEAAGFRLTESPQILRQHYFLRFQKR